MMDFSQIIMAVVTGVVASLVFFVILLCFKPRMKISPYICFDEGADDGEITKYYIKVINKTWYGLIDVQYTLSYINKQSDGKNFIEDIEPLCTPFKTFERQRPIYDCIHKEYDNCMQISYDLNEKRFPVLDDSQELCFTIVARHSVSGTIKYMQKSFNKDSFKCYSQHNLGMVLTYQKTKNVTANRKKTGK